MEIEFLISLKRWGGELNINQAMKTLYVLVRSVDSRRGSQEDTELEVEELEEESPALDTDNKVFYLFARADRYTATPHHNPRNRKEGKM